MVGCHHQLNEHVSEQTPGDSERQGILVCKRGSESVGHDLVTEQIRTYCRAQRTLFSTQ